MATLKSWAEGLLTSLPLDPDEERELDGSAFPALPDALQCSDLVVRRGYHDYDTWRVDYPQWSGSRESFGGLGLAILGSMFQARSLTIHLASTQSEIRSLVILAPRLADLETGLAVLPSRFSYAPSEVSRHPWLRSPPPPEDLPWFKLTNSGDDVLTDAQRAERDCVHGFGSLLGSARFARLLLDLSRPFNQTLEVALECEAGFRGVAPASAEVRLWLPGADYWDAP
jgi:hypothetical protein